MKRFMTFVVSLLVVSSPLLCTPSLDTTEKEELRQILTELKTLNEEQEKLIEDSQKRNEQLEKLSSEQKQQIEELTNLSENKQQIIDEQQITIDELKNLSKEQKKSSVIMWIKIALGIVCAFFGGFLIGRI
jgi:septal ring factor EnvC (AmiA/AmiB activator)